MHGSYVRWRVGRFVPALAVLAVGLVAGVGLDRILLAGREADERFEVRDQRFRFTSPLLECETGEGARGNRELRSFRARLRQVVDRTIATGAAGRVAVYFRDLNNGPWFGVNVEERFVPASLLKVPVMMAVLERARHDPGLLDREIVYRPGPEDLNEVQHIRPRYRLQSGRAYRVVELLHALIAGSDNNARIPLESVVSEQEVAAVFENLGMSLGLGAGGERYISVKAYATIFRILYNASYLPPELSEFALSILASAEYPGGLVAGVPPGVPVAHKFGEYQLGPGQSWRHQLHDCGIVYYPGRPYLLCVMTRGNDPASLDDVIAEVSRTAHDEVARHMTGSGR